MTMTTTHICNEVGCRREFVDASALSDHAQVVHYGDIAAVVSEALKTLYYRAYILDLSADVVVFEAIEDEGEWTYILLRCPYSIDASNVVTLGERKPVIRVVTYEDKVLPGVVG